MDGCVEVGRDELGNPKYGPLIPPYFDIEDDMERAFSMEAFYNPFHNVIVFKKLIDFLGSLRVQLMNQEWVSKGTSTYRRMESDEEWHVKVEVTSPSGKRFGRGFKTKQQRRSYGEVHRR